MSGLTRIANFILGLGWIVLGYNQISYEPVLYAYGNIVIGVCWVLQAIFFDIALFKELDTEVKGKMFGVVLLTSLFGMIFGVVGGFGGIVFGLSAGILAGTVACILYFVFFAELPELPSEEITES